MAGILEHRRGTKRASFISRESSEQFIEFKTQVLKAYQGQCALRSHSLSENPPVPGLPGINMALGLFGWLGLAAFFSPKLKVSEDKYILLS